MKIQTLVCLVVLVAVPSIGMVRSDQIDQSTKTYLQMSADEQRSFVTEQATRIAREISGRNYEFTPEFAAVVQKAVDGYAHRVGNSGGDRLGTGDARFILERGQAYAPTLAASFRAHNVSPLIGLYLPFIESEYVNIQSPSPMGAIGLFQFLPKTGHRFGLTTPELLDVEKSADAAARYISQSLKLFNSDPMREALAVLAYNRGEQRVAQDLPLVITDQNQGCSICALTAASDRLDRYFQNENVHYVPMFFAAAIVGENPGAFGLKSQPLSSYAK